MRDDDGCPCMNTCCDNPSVRTPEHDCPMNDNEFCEECYSAECSNCGALCYCEL